MDYNRKDELDILVGRTLRESVSNEVAPDRVWARIRKRLQERRWQPQSGFGNLRHLGTEVMSWGSEIGTTMQIIFASFYIRSNGEGWTERLILTGHQAVPLHSIHR